MSDSPNPQAPASRTTRDRWYVRRPVLLFWVVATLIEVLLALVFLSSGADAAITRALEKGGFEFNTDLVTAVRVVIVCPAAATAVFLSLLQVAAPDIALFTVTRRRDARREWHAVVRRFVFWSRGVGVRRGIIVWLQMIAVFLAASLMTGAINSLVFSSSEWKWSFQPSVGAFVLALLIALFLDAGALFEENGWRGYALPLLLRRYPPLAASLMLGLAWAAWHYPVKYNAFLDYGLVDGALYMAAFTLKIVLTTIIITYFWQRAGQATIIAVAMHGLSNDSLRVQGRLIGDSSRISILSELTISTPLLIITAFLIWWTRGRLGVPGALATPSLSSR